jgi:O-antigen biosynthesis protein
MALCRVALIFDNLARPETTGVYCRRALGRLVDVEHFLPSETVRIARNEFDLYLAIDDGLNYPFPRDLRPFAYWAIDTHLDFARALRRAGQCDFVFAAQKEGVEQFRSSGIAGARWLPLACDAELHRQHDLPKRFDVTFIGNLLPGPRTELVELIQREFPNSFVGQRYFDEMARAYSESKIVFNRSLKNDLNMRVFEALSCGSLLVTNDLGDNGQADLLRDGKHLVTYRDADELLEKLRFYLRHDELREQIAATGRQEVLARHTYAHRMKALLEAIERPRAAPIALRGALTGSSKENAYYGFARPEVVALIPDTATQILDIGCGAGRLGEALKRRQPAEVTGIELNAQAAADARHRLDEVVVGNVEFAEIDFPDRLFDCVVCADVLEHLREPRAVLERIRRWLTPGGTLVASLPNVRNHTVIRALLDGNWTYEPAGLLDQDHVRFFTRREIENLLFRAGFEISGWQFIPGEGYADWEARGRPTKLTIGGLDVNLASPGEASEFFAYQYLLTARPAARADHGFTSIILVTYNQLAYTRQCLESIRFRTDEPYELIVVDNGSTDGTVDYLRSLEGVNLIVNLANRGFPAAANQGLRAAQGNNLLLLNNDTIVTTGWLRRLLSALHADPAIGLVGPFSNNISGYQEIPVSYGSLESLDGFAWDLSQSRRNERIPVEYLVGFCLLFRRELTARIGFLDEQFGVGCFEDNDYCRRAQQVGYQTVIAADAFVHHFGSRTFFGSGVDLAAALRENEQKYLRKWETPPAAATSPNGRGRAGNVVSVAEKPQPDDAPPRASHSNGKVSSRPFTIVRHPSGGLKLQTSAIKLSLCMIVRDNEKTIGPALESIRPWVDEIVIVDTGSKDRTPEICKEYGARLYHFPWCDDFSAARNESLQHARGEWIFWMDSDDTITAECGRGLRALADNDPLSDMLGWIVQVHCPAGPADGYNDVTIVDHVKLFRNRPDLRFEGRIHEQILPAIRRAGGDVGWTDLYVVHSGSDHSPETRARKLDRDFRILNRELQDQPDHPFVLFNLGMTYADALDFESAIRMLRRCIEVSHSQESHLRKAYALLVGAHWQAQQYEAAWNVSQRGRTLFPEDKELLFRAALLHQHFGRFQEAEQAYLHVLGTTTERHFTSVDRGILGFKTRQNLALVYEQTGALAAAETQWRQIVDEAPRYAIGWRGLGELLIRQQRFDEALSIAQKLSADSAMAREGRILASRLAKARGDLTTARAELAAAQTVDPDDTVVLEEWCRTVYEQGDWAEAERSLSRLAERNPNDGAACHNLGTVYTLQGRHQEAIDAYRESLRRRPNSADTYARLANSLQAMGRSSEAAKAWQVASTLDPRPGPTASARRREATAPPLAP